MAVLCVCVSFKMELVVKVRRRYAWNFSLNLGNLIGSLGSWHMVYSRACSIPDIRIKLKTLTRTLKGANRNETEVISRTVELVYSWLHLEVGI